MSVYSPDLIDIPVEVFGGYCPAIPPSDLPPGAASNAQDVIFPMGGLRQRGGLKTLYSSAAGIPPGANVTGLKSYVTPSLVQRLLAWDTAGNLYKEAPQGTLSIIQQRPYQGLNYQSQTLFGREYQAFWNSLGGADIPRQFDDTNWDRVSQGGPGVSPLATNFQPPAVTVQGLGSSQSATIAGSPNGIVWGGLTVIHFGTKTQSYFTFVTITTTTAHGFTVGEHVTISGSTSTPSMNSTFVIASVATSTTFTISVFVNQNIAVNGGGGTATVTETSTSFSRLNSTVTAITGNVPHGFQLGWQVQISGVANNNIGGGITAISRNNVNIVTVTTTTAHGLVVNSTVAITGVTNPDSSYNGTFTVATVPSSTTFTYSQTGTATSSNAGTGNVQDIWNGTFIIQTIPSSTTFTYSNVGPNDTTSSTGTATIIGQVSGGQHQIAVAFITRQGFITKPSNPATFSAGGNQLIAVSSIPTGPPNITARLLMFTPAIIPPASTASFFSITSTMVIPDNTTTAAIVDFLDSTLIASFSANFLFTQNELGESSFVMGYNSRLVWLGERASVQNLVNTEFDGGFTVVDGVGTVLPNGWTQGTPFAGAGSFASLPAGVSTNGDYQGGYFVVGDGVSQFRGSINQSAYQDRLGVAIIQPNVSYSVRMRARAGNTLTSGFLNITLGSVIGNFVTPGLTITFSQLTSQFQEFTGLLTAPLLSVPTDLTLTVVAGGTLNSGGTIIYDSIQVFPTNSPFNYSTARISHSFNPESYDATTGQIQIRPNDGQRLRAGFPLRNNLYLGKDHYLCYVTDDGINEPASWAVNEVSATIGICGSNAVDWTEEWAVFAERSGVYVCWGTDPVKISQEIQFDASDSGKITWASINWAAGHTIWVKIDSASKQILIGAPVNGSLTPNVVFLMDYKWLTSAQDIADSPMVTYSAFTGKMLSHGRGRRWATWSVAASSMALAERTDGTAQPFFGSIGKIQQQLDCAVQNSDDGTPIGATWTGYGMPSHMEEMQMQLGAHRKLAGYLKFRAKGAGTVFFTVTTAQRSNSLRGYTLSTAPVADGERPINMHGERFFLTVSMTLPGAGYGSGGYGIGGYGFGFNQLGQSQQPGWFQMEQFILCIKKDAVMPVRGVS